MTGTIRVFVNERSVVVPAGATAETAVVTADPTLAGALGNAQVYLTDGRGIPIPGDAPLSAGAIVRIVRSSRLGRTETDAEP